MDAKVTCEFCTYFANSKIIQKKIDEENPKKSSKEPILKRCKASRNKINIDSSACEFFDPSTFFYCQKNNCRIAVIQCINRRRNEKGLRDYDDCLKCRQWEKWIKYIADEFWMKGQKAKPPKKSIRRREKSESKITRRRKPVSKIKRREKPIKTRITRRDKPANKRKIKRRAK